MHYETMKETTYKKVSLCNARASFTGNFVTAGNIYDIDDVVGKFPAEVGSQIVCNQTN